MYKQLDIMPSKDVDAYLKCIKEYIDNFDKMVGIPFPNLLKEFEEYSAKMALKPSAPPFNTDAYWDWRCNKAKIELHKNIEVKATVEKIMDTYHSYGILLNYYEVKSYCDVATIP